MARPAATRRATEGASSASPKASPKRPRGFAGVPGLDWAIGLAVWGGFALLMAAFFGAW